MMYIDNRSDEEVMAQTMYDLNSIICNPEIFLKERKEINNTSSNDLEGVPFTVHTTEVFDRPYTYETAFKSEKYNDGDWIIIDHCDDEDIAEIKHKMWVEYFITNAPNHITDDWTTVVYLRDE